MCTELYFKAKVNRECWFIHCVVRPCLKVKVFIPFWMALVKGEVINHHSFIHHHILLLLNDNNSVTAFQNFSLYTTVQWELTAADLVTSASNALYTGLKPTTIHCETVEQVSSFKYLGLTINNKFRFSTHHCHAIEGIQQRLHVRLQQRMLPLSCKT